MVIKSNVGLRLTFKVFWGFRR